MTWATGSVPTSRSSSSTPSTPGSWPTRPQSRYIGELVKLGLTEEQADRRIKEFGISEELIRGKVAEEAIARVPAVVQVRVSREKALHNLNRQQALSKKGA